MNQNYPKGVEVVASALIVKKNKEILLIKSHKWSGGIYLLPGGHVEPGETVMEAAQREGEEETGLKLKPLYCVNVGELINSPLFNRSAHLVWFHYVCKALTEEVKLDDKELSEFIWIKPEEANKLKILDRMKQTIKNYIEGVKINISSDVFE